MAGKEAAFQVVDKVGNVLVSADETGLRDGSGYISYHEVNFPVVAASVNTFIWRNTHLNKNFRMVSAGANTSVAGGSGATVTVGHCAGGVAIASATAQLTAALDLNATAPAKLPGILITTPNIYYPGDVMSLTFAGTLTSLVGIITVVLGRLT